MEDHHLRQDRFNTSLQFIRPSPTSDSRSKTTRPFEHADPLGITYHAARKQSPSATPSSPEDHGADLFRELKFPHVKPPAPLPIVTQRRSSEGGFLPLLSSSPSPTSSSSSAAASPLLRNTLRRDTLRTKCQLTHRASTTSPQSASMSAKSWDHLKSPAASFLASFATFSDVPAPHLAEEDGDEIGDYVFEKVIGCGGFSTVRLASRRSDGLKVAIKIMQKLPLPEAEQRHDQSNIVRLERELDIWQRLDHPNIVRVHEILETDDAIYVVCDYCPHNLMEKVNREPMTESQARSVFLQLCCALSYLHDACKVCHKDLKLENVLLDQDGTVKLCDFGLAIYQSATGEQLDEFVSGTLAYASPEQIRSKRSLTCPKTDVWSLGVILYTLTTRKLPFRDQLDSRLQEKILTGVVDIPTDVSPSLQQLLQGCLTIDPAQRYSLADVLNSSWCTQAQ